LNVSASAGMPPVRDRARTALVYTLTSLLGALVLSTSLVEAATANSCVSLSGGVPPDRLAALSQGVNADGWFGNPSPEPMRPAVLQQLREAGLTHLRLPVPAERIMRRFASPQERQSTLDELDHALRQFLSIGYSVVVDLHPGDRFNRLHSEDAEASMLALTDAWRDLAQVISRHPADRVFAELLNEPDVPAGRWQDEVETLAGFVRQLLPDVTIVVGPVNWQRADSLPGFRPLADANTVYAIHFYDPMIFTHQGHWDEHDPLHSIRGLPFPFHADDNSVQALRSQLRAHRAAAALDMLDRAMAGEQDVRRWLEPAVNWQRRFSRPIVIDEFGVLKAAAPRDSRLRWLSSVTQYAREHCWGWTHWELAQGFGLLDDRTGLPDPEVLKALLNSRTGN
jgi:endoglucanase